MDYQLHERLPSGEIIMKYEGLYSIWCLFYPETGNIKRWRLLGCNHTKESLKVSFKYCPSKVNKIDRLTALMRGFVPKRAIEDSEYARLVMTNDIELLIR